MSDAILPSHSCDELHAGMEGCKTGEHLVYATALHAFTFDLSIITIEFTSDESIAKPIY